jgi:N utilization substance protein B
MEQAAVGSVRVANEVIASIAAMAVREIDGVAGLDQTNARHFGDWIKRETAHRGVRVALDSQHKIHLEVFVTVTAGATLVEVAERVQDNVIEAVERMLGLQHRLYVGVRVAGPRHRARELALKVLFQLEHSPGDDVNEALAYHAAEDGPGGEEDMFARELVYGVIEHQAELDEVIRNASRNWKLEQMGRVDRIVLRIAIYEITIARKVPVKAAINESIELAKTFSGDESGRFVNGVLGKVAETVA